MLHALRRSVPSSAAGPPAGALRLQGPRVGTFLLVLFLAAGPVLATAPPVPGKPSAACDALVGAQCFVNGTFTLAAYSAGAHHYRFCRSNDTTGWGGCNVVMTSNSGSSFTVSGSNLPGDGYQRAYYVSACDGTGNCTSWSANTPAYVKMDLTGPTAPGNTAVACASTTGSDCWVTGSFTVSATPASDTGSGVGGYRICRSNDITGWGGCDVDLVPIGSGGTSVTVSGSHLPSDGYRRAYYFAARDAVGNYGAWNSPRYVRVDRYAPTVSASNASTQWFASRTAVVSAADTTGGAAANSGLVAVRYSWATPLDGACTGGTATSAGATLTVPEGDNTLFVCARDATGRVAHWSGPTGSTPARPPPPGRPRSTAST